MWQSIRLIRLTHFVFLVVLIGHLLIIGKQLLIPAAFGLLLAFLLYPIVKWLEGRVKRPALPILLAVLLAFVPIGLIIWFFSMEITMMIRNLGSIDTELRSGLDQLFQIASEWSGMTPTEEKHWFNVQIEGLLDRSFGTITTFLASSTTVLAELIITLIFTFFILLYRKPFHEFLLIQFPEESRPEVSATLMDAKVISRNYVTGLAVLTLVLAVMYSIGLWIIGIPYAPFWGMLMAVMNIIPYIGNLLGLIFLCLYALASTGGLLAPVLVLAIHFFIQTLEGNLIRPYIVGSNVNVNALAAILSFLVGGFMWGVAGLVLALPYTAILKVICDRISFLQPVGELLGSGISPQGGLLTKYDAKKFQLNQFFNRIIGPRAPGGREGN